MIQLESKNERVYELRGVVKYCVSTSLLIICYLEEVLGLLLGLYLDIANVRDDHHMTEIVTDNCHMPSLVFDYLYMPDIVMDDCFMSVIIRHKYGHMSLYYDK